MAFGYPHATSIPENHKNLKLNNHDYWLFVAFFKRYIWRIFSRSGDVETVKHELAVEANQLR